VVSSENILRKDADFMVDFHLPPLERIYAPPTWLHLGTKLKHVVEADAEYEYVTGVNEFQKIIHFDSTDNISDTNHLTVSLTNRLYKKTKNGDVNEFLTWRVTQARYFDPTFGNTVVAGQRTVNYAAVELTPYAFLDGPRGF
jgi:LPS-assembly protein